MLTKLFECFVVSIVFIIGFLRCHDSNTTVAPDSVGPETKALQADLYDRMHFVSTDGSDGEGDGSQECSWRSIPYALAQIRDNAAGNRYALCVAEGEYTGQTVVMKPFVDLYGGFDQTDWSRDVGENRSVLNGGGKRRVVVGADNARLDGFVVARGVVRGKGAGLLCNGVSPVITNNIFTRNKTLSPVPWKPTLRHQIANDGGAIYAKDGASPVVENNLFFENETEVGRGAGIALHGRCGGRIADNVFLYNSAGVADPMRSSDGGAISVFEWSHPVIENNIILENKALTDNDGGGIFTGYWSSPEITGNVIVGNWCGDDGGGIFTSGQDHHDEIPPQFDPIPDEENFFIRITENVFVGNNEALEFSMESRGLVADNIVALNGAAGTHPMGVYFQRSEAHVINNTILDPFLVNFKTFDNKLSSEGLKPSTIEGNRFFGPFRLETEAIVKENFILDTDANYSNRYAELWNDWIHLYADGVYYGNYRVKEIYTTRLFVSSASFRPDALVNRVVKTGDRWSVVKSNTEQIIEVWGDVNDAISFAILPTYRLKEM